MKTDERNSYTTHLRNWLNAAVFGRFRAPGLLICVALILIATFSAALLRPTLIREDGPVENASAILFLFASLMGAWHLMSPSRLTQLDHRLVLVSTLLSLLFFLSEISFGARYFDLDMPQMEGGGEFDGGHDIVIVLFRMLMKGDGLSVLVGGGLLMALGGMVYLAYRFRNSLRAFLEDSFHFALFVLFLVLVSAVLLDLVPSRTATKLEEALEFASAFVVIWAFFQVRRG